MVPVHRVPGGLVRGSDRPFEEHPRCGRQAGRRTRRAERAGPGPSCLSSFIPRSPSPSSSCCGRRGQPCSRPDPRRRGQPGRLRGHRPDRRARRCQGQWRSVDSSSAPRAVARPIPHSGAAIRTREPGVADAGAAVLHRPGPQAARQGGQTPDELAGGGLATGEGIGSRASRVAGSTSRTSQSAVSRRRSAREPRRSRDGARRWRRTRG
jgi:hypothetical protein